MPLTDKTFPIRMAFQMYRRLETQAERFGLSVTAYIRQTIANRLEIDERCNSEDLKKVDK